MKTLDYYMGLNYPVELSIIPDNRGGGYLAKIPLIPGCLSDGETPEDALRNIEDAKRELITDMIEAGQEISEPPQNEKYNGQVVCRVPKSFHRLLGEQAKREGVSLEQYIMSSLSFATGALNKA